jgi:flavin reductase (DIM6/NTAB) family NADH-FMN oxidoreductase RutF
MICVLPDPQHQWNLIAVSFNMSCSYKPPMIAIAIQDINRSHGLIREASEFVLAVPGPELASQTMTFGWETSRETDKSEHGGVRFIQSETIGVPGLLHAIANVELRKVGLIDSGDHVIAIGEVTRFAVNRSCRGRNLLSVGPDTSGYRLVAERGIHRIAVIAAPDAATDDYEPE